MERAHNDFLYLHLALHEISPLYNHYYHFTEPPFSIAPDPHFIYMSMRHQEGLAHLLYGITQSGGFVTLTGEVGTGKTTLCHCLLQQLPGDIDIALVLNPKLNSTELLAAICDELGMDYDRHPLNLKNLTDGLNRHLLKVHGEGRRTVVLIDEAQNLSLEVLEQIRLLTNLETSKTKLLQIILVGQPELRDLLGRRDLRQLNQRITARYHLLPLSKAETDAYIRHRLMVSGGDPALFKPAAMRKVHKLSGGIPRVINILCERALLGGFSLGVDTIDARIVKRAAAEALAETKTNGKLYFLWVVSAVMIMTAGFWWARSFLKTPTVPPLFLKSPALAEVKPLAIKPAMVRPAELTEAKLPAPVFNDWLENTGLSLNDALRELLASWGKAPTEGHPADCAAVHAAGLNCLFGKAAWPEIVALDRPAVMEFDSKGRGKRYAVLKGIDEKKALIYFHGNAVFPLTEVMPAWNGYYLLIWQSPQPNLGIAGPGQADSGIPWVRKQLQTIYPGERTVKNPQFFDADLKKQVIAFQTRQHLKPDGIVGAQTIIHLDNLTGAPNSTHLQTPD